MWNEKLRAATNIRWVWRRPHEGRLLRSQDSELCGVWRRVAGVVISEVSKALLLLDTLLVSNPAKQCQLNDTSTGVCIFKLLLCLHRGEAGGRCAGGGGGAKGVRVGPKKFVKMFYSYVCVCVCACYRKCWRVSEFTKRKRQSNLTIKKYIEVHNNFLYSTFSFHNSSVYFPETAASWRPWV
jgi:hypothetical protein